jgi:phosphoglycolate phosphatase
MTQMNADKHDNDTKTGAPIGPHSSAGAPVTGSYLRSSAPSANHEACEIRDSRCPAAVLFDFDGTLVDAPIDFGRMRRDLLRTVAEAGIDPAGLAERDLLSIVAHVRERVPEPGRFVAAAEAALMAVELECSDQAREVAGASELLLWLQEQGIRVGIVTRNCRAVVERVLERIPLRHGVLLTRTEVTRVKPDPEHLLRALAHLEARPEEALMVGDHWMDVQAGRAAGMATVGILAPGRPEDFFDREPPDHVIRELRELIAWISP